MSDYLKTETLDGIYETASATSAKVGEEIIKNSTATSVEVNATIVEEKSQEIPTITNSGEERHVESIPYGEHKDPEYMVPKVVTVKKYVLKK